MTATRRGALVVGLIAALSACQPPADQSASAAEAVRAADIAWAKAFSSKDLAGAVGFVDSTGSILPPNAPIVTGAAAVRAMFEGYYALPDLSGAWQPTQVEAAHSGDLAYSTGTYELSFKDPSGKPVTDRGKYATIWRKQADGSFKVVLDIFNSDSPPPGTAPL